MSTLVPAPESFATGLVEKEKVGRKKPHKVHSKTLGCIQIRGAAELSTDLQEPQVYEREHGRPEKWETENGFVSPDYQNDNCKHPD
ncbi:MAG: hypothetical protein EPN47_21130 [Acidobacteria bacterium]|nr:MAG: hypothetical protein EPN47_21130 [Acidobacteriota bacterium]